MDTGLKFPTTSPTPGISNFWSNPSNAYSENGVFTSVISGGFTSQDFGTFNFGFSGNELIVGMEVYIKGKVDLDFHDLYVQIKGKNSGGTSGLYPATFSTINTETILGSPTDNWGLSVNGSFWANSNAYVKILAADAGTTYYVDSIKVVVYYTVPVVPTVTTQSSSSVTSNSLVGNGNITDKGGADVTRRGFCCKIGISGDPTLSDSISYDDGSFTVEAYTKLISGLLPLTNYRVRAYATNSAGTGYGVTVQVTTLAGTAGASLMMSLV